MQKDLEARLLSLILVKPETYGQVIQQGVSTDSFVAYQEIFSFIQKHSHKYNCVPSLEIIQSNFNEPFFVKDVPLNEVKYLSDELIKNGVARKAVGIVNKYQDLLITDTYGAIDSIVTQLTQIKKSNSFYKSLTDKDAIKRLQLIRDRKDAIGKGRAIGMRTGISALDRRSIGWQLGQLVLVVGRPKVGKSWLSQFIACNAYMDGNRILYVSPEMSTVEVDLRFDTVMGKMSGYQFLNDKLTVGDIDLVKYTEWLTKLSKRSDWITLDSNNGHAFSVPAIASLIDEYSPTLVVVDGVVLLEGPGDADWERVKNIAYSLKTLAQNKKVVILGATQAARGAGANMPDASQIAYSDALLQAADLCIMMQSEPENPDIRYITIPVARGHQAINKRMIVKFDVNKGVIEV
jgi:replicative DNA helicase